MEPLNAVNRPVGTVVTSVAKVPNEDGPGFDLDFTTLDMIQDVPQLRQLLARANGDGEKELLRHPNTDSGASSKDTKKKGAGARRRQAVKPRGK